MNIVPIAFAFDDNLVLPACVCISSLLVNANKDTFYDIFILYPEKECLRKKDLEKISDYYPNCRINYRTIGMCFDDAFEIRGITTPAYYRLLIPDVISEYDKVIYSDVDIIFRTDLYVLYNQDITDYYLGATYDFGLNLSMEGKKYIDSVPELIQGVYIQSGFIVLNSRLIRSVGLVETFKSFARKKYRYQDQDILNIACKGHIKIIPFSYNMTDQTFYYLEKEPHLLVGKYQNADVGKARLSGNIHFNGAKPWNRYCANFDIWWEYYRKSPLFNSLFYFDFFYSKLDEYDRLPFIKRVKILLRYFLHRK